MKTIFALLLVCLAGPAIAEPVGGQKLDDGSVFYALQGGVITASANGTVVLTTHTSPDVLSVDLPGFKLETVDSKSDSVMFFAVSSASQFSVSVYLEQVTKAKSSADCRNLFFERALQSPSKKNSIRRSEQRGFAIGQYLVAKVKEVAINQQHWNAFHYADGHCTDLHVSKIFYDATKDDLAFQTILASFRAIPKKPE